MRAGSENRSRRVSLLPGISEGFFRPSFNRILSDPDEQDSDESEPEESAETEHDSSISGGRSFQAAVGLVILANTVMVSLECALIQHERYKIVFRFCETVFTIIYLAEITLRVKEQGLLTFFFGEDFMWNWFDFLVTVAGVLDSSNMVLGASFASKKIHGASSTRLFRILRIMRIFRAFKFVSDIDFVIATAAAATVKLAVLVLLLLLVSAIITTNVLWDASDQHVKSLFGNLGQSMWTLFKLMTLEEWIPLVERVERINPEMRVFFVLFIFFGSIALMSLVPAVFVELQLLERNKIKEERLAVRRRLRRRSQKELLRRLFQLADTDEDGVVSIVDLQDALENPDVQDELSGKFTLSMAMGDTGSRAKSLHASLGLTETADFRDLKFGVFLFWADKLFEMTDINDDDEAEKFAEAEFIRGMLQIWGDVDMNVLWRNMTATRIYLMANGGCGGSNVARRFCGNPDRWLNVLDSLDPQSMTASKRASMELAKSASLDMTESMSAPEGKKKKKLLPSRDDSSDHSSGIVSRNKALLSRGMSNLSSRGTNPSTNSTDLSADIRLLNIKVGEVHQQIIGLAAEVAKETSALVDIGCIRLQKYVDDSLRQFGRYDEDKKHTQKNDFAILRETFSSGSAKVATQASHQQQSWLPANLSVGSTTALAVPQSPKKVTKLRWKESEIQEFHASRDDELDEYALDVDPNRRSSC